MSENLMKEILRDMGNYSNAEIERMMVSTIIYSEKEMNEMYEDISVNNGLEEADAWQHELDETEFNGETYYIDRIL